MKKITMKDIANELQITVGAVSHAFNNRDDISEDMRKRIFETAKQMGYISNGVAASLRSGKTNTIAIIIPDISNPLFAQQIKMVEQLIRKKNYTTIILNTDEDDELERRAITTAYSKQVDGILICPTQRNMKNIQFLKELSIPFVLIGRFFKELDTDYVCADDFAGGYLAGSYLLNRGFRKILYIGTYDYIEPNLNRFDGIVKSHKEHNLSYDMRRKFSISPKSGYNDEVIAQLKTDDVDFDAVIAFSDLLAFESISALNINVPIVGFDAIHSFLPLPFPYASIAMKKSGWAEQSVKILFSKMNGKADKAFHCLIDVDLYEFGDVK